MNDRVKHTSRRSERSPTRHRKKKKSRKRSSSSSQDCIVVTSQRNTCNKEKKRKSRKKKHHRSSSSVSSSSDSSALRLKLRAKPKQLIGERPEFCRNTLKYGINSGNGESLDKNHQASATEIGKREREHRNTANSKDPFRTLERRVVGLMSDARGRKRDVKDRLGGPVVTKRSKKSRKRKRSSSCSSSTRCTSSSRSSSSNSSSNESRRSSSSSSSSSSDSSEKRRRRKKKKKLAKKMKREEKRRKEEKRKLKKLKEKIKMPTKEIKRGIVKAPPDRLLKDINMELADRAKAMAPMTREQWLKKQSVIRRVYDGETGRHRLIKGDGEVLEEIVSRDRHMAINRQATKGDGEFFQSRLTLNK